MIPWLEQGRHGDHAAFYSVKPHRLEKTAGIRIETHQRMLEVRSKPYREDALRRSYCAKVLNVSE
jgi:hypothetical protein